MLQKDIERRLATLLRSRGAMSLKLECPVAGVPDRLVILPGGRIVFVELKQERGKLSKVQEMMIDRLSNMGCDVRVLYGMEQVERFVRGVCADEV